MRVEVALTVVLLALEVEPTSALDAEAAVEVDPRVSLG